MSIKVRNTILIKINQQEYDVLMFSRSIKFTPTKKGIWFLKKVKDKLPFGRCELVVQNGEPHRIIKALDDDLLILPTVEKPFDKNPETCT